METGDRVRHIFNKIYGIGTIVDVVGEQYFVSWESGSSMEPVSNLVIVEENDD